MNARRSRRLREPNDNTHNPETNALSARVAISVDAWKRKLLDLTRRNRALNFRATRSSTVTITDEIPGEVFRHIVLQEKSMRFRAAEADANDADAGAGETDLFDQGVAASDATDTLSSTFTPYERARLHERHMDDILQTDASADHLDRQLRRLGDLARSTLEEQGVATLFLALGMLRYRESEASSEWYKAPIILVPVTLKRTSARTGYRVAAGDDEPMVNPALAETLRRSYGIEVPELPESDARAESYDLQALFGELEGRISRMKDWEILNDIVLGQFSFQKFVMYKDLEETSERIAAHPVIQQMVGRSGTTLVGLPDDVRGIALDEVFPPEQTFQVVDADSSQARAIAAVARGHHLVLEGPPGTGKSQTITNLIAQALAGGESVLFVAEKMAALEVVHKRLKEVGLDEFCLELHSSKANKRQVIGEIARAIDLSLETAPEAKEASRSLPQVRARLTEYARAVHAPHGRLNISPYRAFGELEKVVGAPVVTVTLEGVREMGAEELEAAERDLEDLAVVSEVIGDPTHHPWRGCTKTYLTDADIEIIKGLCTEASASMSRLETAAARLAKALHRPSLKTFAEVDKALAIAELLERSPGAPLEVLRSEAWNAPPQRVLDLIAVGKRIVELRSDVCAKMTPEALERDHEEDVAYVFKKTKTWARVFNLFSGRYREISRRWRKYRLPDYKVPLRVQAFDMRRANELRKKRAALDGQVGFASESFGALWKGEESGWDDLERYVAWVVEMRGVCVKEGLDQGTLEVASGRTLEHEEVSELTNAACDAKSVLGRLRAALGGAEEYLEGDDIKDIRDRANALIEHHSLGVQWAAFESARQKVAAGVAGDFLGAAMKAGVAFADLGRAFRRAFFRLWLDGVVGERPALRAFNCMTHEQRVREFKRLDRDTIVENRCRLTGELRARTQEKLQSDDARECLPVLRREMTRQRGLAPLRRTLTNAAAAIRAIKPCYMMSPLTVAQFLSPDGPVFDLVIFDEASQLPPEDAIGSILRGEQLIVVGDPKQLPPTNFFAVVGGYTEPLHDNDGETIFEDSESILEDFAASGAPRSRLRWHYRSAHESLITFSNANFYDSTLFTFPSVETDSHERGVRFEYVHDGLYEGAGVNRAEARRVAADVVAHIKDTPHLSLGVGTFSLRQQEAVKDEVERWRRQDPELEAFFASDGLERFFVKNLENIQGDERDVIFLSITYAKAADGRLRYNFGPLNAENGWRRLNVLTTRARQHMRVFSSIRSDDIDASTNSKGALLLRGFLAYAEKGTLDTPMASEAAKTESPFEQEVFAELTRRGIRVVPQVGASGYRIDLGVIDPERPGRYVCGLECDGMAYHSSETARDRDRLRQEVLESRGWIIHRIWSTDWFKDRNGQIERILRLIGESRQRASTATAEVRPRKGPSAVRGSTTGHGPEGASPAEVERDGPAGYASPSAEPYRAFSSGSFGSEDGILHASPTKVAHAVVCVVEAESPIHEELLLSRVAGLWGNRAGARIASRIREAVRRVVHGGRIRRAGDFLWAVSGEFTVRDRSGMTMPAGHIAPEEYAEAALVILRTGHAFSRDQLKAEVRSLLGFARTGHLLDAEIESAIDRLMLEGLIGEASSGYRLRPNT